MLMEILTINYLNFKNIIFFKFFNDFLKFKSIYFRSLFFNNFLNNFSLASKLFLTTKNISCNITIQHSLIDQYSTLIFTCVYAIFLPSCLYVLFMSLWMKPLMGDSLFNYNNTPRRYKHTFLASKSELLFVCDIRTVPWMNSSVYVYADAILGTLPKLLLLLWNSIVEFY